MGSVRDIVIRAYCGAFARPAFYRLNRSLFSLTLHGIGLLNSADLRVSGEFAFLKRFLQRRPAPVVLDVGANRGDYSGLVMKLAPHATVYAFEPHPVTFLQLAQRAEAMGFTALNMACSDRMGPALLFDRSESAGGTSHATLVSDSLAELYGQKTHAIDVNVTTIDEVIKERGVKHVDLLKIDTEGHEYRILQGAQTTLEEGRIDAIQFEFNEMNVIRRVFLRDFRILLAGYELYRILPSGMLPMRNMGVTESELFGFQNIVALRERSGLDLA